MTEVKTFKAALLAVLIIVGLSVHSGPARAADTQVLTVAGGCFWCVESDFESVSGVKEVISGFTGGTVPNPTYKQVTSGGTGHYEAVQIIYDPSKVSREDLLSKFFRSIDPTDAGGQFCDRGSSYRSAVFAANPADQAAAEKAKADAQNALGQTVVTPILGASQFYKADEYHQDYYKGSKLVITRFGPKRQSKAYKAYRNACGRDARVLQLWGNQAPFVGS